tara:strand:+ start:1820 stop:3574 length:1755 start_codon:yes stop_codon:yes gene_type:complete
MVKLVRLTTQDSRAVFSSNLDTGISVSKNASIALQNLTFSSDFQVLNVTTNNGLVRYSIAQDLNTLSFNLPRTEYTNVNYRDFYIDYEASLNGCLSVSQPTPLDGDVYGSFKVVEEGDKVITSFKYSPMVMPFIMNADEEPRQDANRTSLFDISTQSAASNDDSININTNKSNRPTLGNMTSANAANLAQRQNYICPQDPNIMWCKGSAMWMCRVDNLVDFADADDKHGFGIGLSFTDIQRNTELNATIQPTSRDFEVLVEKTGNPYRFISPTNPNTEQISTTIPFKYDISVDTDPFTHDHIIFQRNKNVITACIWNTSDGLGNGVRNELFSYTLTRVEAGKSLFPYIYIKANAFNCEVGRPIVTMDALEIDGNESFEVTGQLQNIGGFAVDNAFQAIANLYADCVPILNNNRFLGTFNLQEPKVYSNGEILRFLGYDENRFSANIEYFIGLPETELYHAGDPPLLQFDLVPEGQHQVVNSDNFVVVIDNYSVFSYDSSRTNYGPNSLNPPNQANRARRFNIIATIPKNDNSGFLEYQPNELVYIDLDLAEDIVIKNLNLRVLNKNLNPININGRAIMTLLIQD